VFTTRPVLVAPDLDKEMRVEADTLEYATGGILSMKCEDKKWRLVAFISKLLNEAERNYEIHDREMLAIIVRATRAEHSRRFLCLNYVIEYVTTHLQEIPQRIR